MAKSPAKKQAVRTAESDHKLYTFDVSIIDGPMTESFLKRAHYAPLIHGSLGGRKLHTLSD